MPRWSVLKTFPRCAARWLTELIVVKALAALSVAELVLFSVPAIVGYRYLGQYAEAPMYASLQENFKKGGFGPVIVPTVIVREDACRRWLTRTRSASSTRTRRPNSCE